MMTRLPFAVFVLFVPQWFLVSGNDIEYTNKWVAEIPAGEEVAQRVARDLGYNYKGQVTGVQYKFTYF